MSKQQLQNNRRGRRGQPRNSVATADLGNQVVKILNRQAEHKYSDEHGDAAANYNGLVTLLNGIATGDDYASRTGYQVRLQRVSGQMYYRADATATLPQCARTVLIWDREPNGTLPAWDDIFSNPTVPEACCAILQPTGDKRFTILWDNMQEVGTYSASHVLATGSNPVARFDIDLGNRLTSFTPSGAATISAIQRGGLYLCTMSSASTASPSQYYDIVVRYTDL